MFKLELEYKNGILFARLKGILNRKNSYKINNYLNPVIKKHEIKYLVYNFEDFEIESTKTGEKKTFTEEKLIEEFVKMNNARKYVK